MHFVEDILEVEPYRLTLRFNAGEVRRVDLEPMLRARSGSPQSAFARLIEPATFTQVQLDRAAHTICWKDLAREIQADGSEKPAPLDLCPDTIYGLSTPVARSDPRWRVSA